MSFYFVVRGNIFYTSSSVKTITETVSLLETEKEAILFTDSSMCK